MTTRELNRFEKMTALAMTMTQLIKAFGRRNDITVEYSRCTAEEIAAKFTEWERKYYGIRASDEYFLVYENPAEGKSLLYAVNVSGDSELTAAAELMDLASRKSL